jgi:hypothetical protein
VPRREEALFNGLLDQELDFQVPVVLRDPGGRGLESSCRPLQQLEIDVRAADQGAGQAVTGGEVASVRQNTLRIASSR